jgi:hypothetical protein
VRFGAAPPRPGTHHSEEIAGALDMASSELGSVRNQLIKKDVLFAPSRNSAEFRLPLPDACIDRISTRSRSARAWGAMR